MSIPVGYEPKPELYTIGGTIGIEGKIYIPRRADEELLRHCLAGDFCYILTARQMGKSSLMTQVARKLDEGDEAIHTVRLDLTRIGGRLKSPDQFYLGLILGIIRHLKLDIQPTTWWESEERKLFSPVQRFEIFLRQEVLTTITGKVIIFIDEIDTLRSFRAFSVDDFFALIRAIYNARSEEATYQRLSFVLLGFAQPYELINDHERTPFNIGVRIQLTDFTFDEALGLTEGWATSVEESKEVIGWVLEWTGGHPYLSQKVCKAISEKSEFDKVSIERIISDIFLNSDHLDDNLQFVRNELISREREVIITYYKMLSGRAVYDNEEDPVDILVKDRLKLASVVRSQNQQLQIRNKIYQTYFNIEWVSEHLWRYHDLKLEIVELGLRRIESNSVVKVPIPEVIPEDNAKMEPLASNETEVLRDNRIDHAVGIISILVIVITLVLSVILSINIEFSLTSILYIFVISTVIILATLITWLLPDKHIISTAGRLLNSEGVGGRQWRAFLSQSNSRLTVAEYAALHIISSSFFFQLSYFILFPGDQITGFFFGILGFFIPSIYYTFYGERRLAELARQLPDTLLRWANKLGLGFGLVQSLEGVARESLEPTATEFKRMLQEIHLGIDFNDALKHMRERVAIPDFDLIAVTIRLQQSVGGNLERQLLLFRQPLEAKIDLLDRVKTCFSFIHRMYIIILGVLIVFQWGNLLEYFDIALKTTQGQFVVICALGLISTSIIVASESNAAIRRLSVVEGSNLFVGRVQRFDLLIGLLTASILSWSNVPLVILMWFVVVIFYTQLRYPLTAFVILSPILIDAISLLNGYPSAFFVNLSKTFDLSSSVLTPLTQASVAEVVVVQDRPVSPVLLGTIIVTGLLILTAIIYVGIKIDLGINVLQERLAMYLDRELPDSLEEVELQLSFRDRILIPILVFFANILAFFAPPRYVEYFQRRIELAGLGGIISVAGFFLLQLVSTIVISSLGVFVFLGMPTSTTPFTPSQAFFGALGAIVLGFFLPIVWLSNRRRKRHARIIRALPDALDLMLMCVEADLGWEVAMEMIYEEWDNEVGLVFGRLVRDIQSGKEVFDALDEFSTRLEVPEIFTLSNTILQFEQFSGDLENGLRELSKNLRQSQQELDEKQLQRTLQIQRFLLSCAGHILFTPGLIIWLIAPLISQTFA